MADVDAPPLAYQQPGNYCRCCSPNQQAIGEPGEECCQCGAPVTPSALELAATRSARNALRLVPRGSTEVPALDAPHGA